MKQKEKRRNSLVHSNSTDLDLFIHMKSRKITGNTGLRENGPYRSLWKRDLDTAGIDNIFHSMGYAQCESLLRNSTFGADWFLNCHSYRSVWIAICTSDMAIVFSVLLCGQLQSNLECILGFTVVISIMGCGRSEGSVLLWMRSSLADTTTATL